MQAIIELQKSIGAMSAKIDAVEASVGSVKGSVDGMKTKVDDLVALKNKFIGGLVATSVIIGAVGFVLGKASDYVTIKLPPQSSPTSPPAPPQATASKSTP